MATDVPQTVWQPTDGLSEFGNETPNNIVDNLSNYLVDPSGNFIVDTGVIQTLIPSTIWEENDAI